MNIRAAYAYGFDAYLDLAWSGFVRFGLSQPEEARTDQFRDAHDLYFDPLPLCGALRIVSLAT